MSQMWQNLDLSDDYLKLTVLLLFLLFCMFEM